MYRRIIWMVVGFGAAVLSAILFTRPEFVLCLRAGSPAAGLFGEYVGDDGSESRRSPDVVADLRPQGSAHTAGLPGHEYEQRRRPAALHL